MTSESSPACPECGKPVPADSPHQLCPACLMGQALASRTLVEEHHDVDAPAPLSPEEIAEKFPQFEIIECLGRGGMGSVYKARQKSLDRWVAIKILAPEREGRERFAERFAREAQTLARLSHPHIVTIHDFGQTGGLFYLVMEFVDGVNLRELLRDGKMEPAQALAIVPPICDALQYAHQKGIVHRDIKPENLLLDRDGRVKIADFGIASLIGAENESAGTPAYMAPEQADAKREVDHRADIYALGVVLYEMLTGERPGKEVIAPSRKVQIDVRLDEIVLRALEKEPGRRYQTVEEFRTVVDTVAGDGKNATPHSLEPAPRKANSPVVFRTLLTAALAFGLGFFLWNLSGHRFFKNTTEERNDPGDVATAVDLTPFYHSKFDVVERFPGLSAEIDGIPLTPSGSIQLYGTQNALRDHVSPMSVTGIPIGRKFDELHLLHNAGWEEIQDRAVAVIRLHYEDGSHRDCEIRYGVHLLDWNRLPSEEKETLTDADSKLVWRGAGAYGGTGRLFKTTLRNPNPNRVVKSMEVISSETRVSYQLFAATTANHSIKRVTTPGLPLNKPAFAFEGALKVKVVDSLTGKPIADADIAPWGMIGGENIVVPPQLTSANGEIVVKYPVNRTEDFHLEVNKPGYRMASGSWVQGNIPREQTFRLEPVKDTPISVSPHSRPGAPLERPGVMVELSKDGRIRLDGRDLPSEELLKRLQAIQSTSPDQPVTIRADYEGRYADVMKVLELCKEARLSNVSFVAKPIEGDLVSPSPSRSE
ncbi:MAG TPA: protein kinase [Luteolibacter sp.]